MDFIYFRFAQIQMDRENWLAAREAITAYRATPSGQCDLASALLLAEVERREGNLDASVRQYEAIFRQAKSLRFQEAALLGLSGVRQSQKSWEQALIAYERLINLKPQSDRAQLGSAYISLKLQQMTVAQAETVLETWLANYPTIPAAMVPSELLDLVGELPPMPRRFELYETLIANNPAHLGLNRRYAQALALVDPEAALMYLDAIAPDDPAVLSFYFVQGEVARILGELELASEAYETILVQAPDNVDALSALGGIRFEQRRFAEAELLYEEVLAFRPDDWEIRHILAELQLAYNHPLSAFQQLTDFAEMQPTDITLEHHEQEIYLNYPPCRRFQPDWEQY